MRLELIRIRGDNMTIKPIETVYKGYKFRSRLEARWAVFFDALGIEWEYEKEGYYLGDSLCYLPDFWLPKLDMFVEIKGNPPTYEERKKAFYLNKLSKKPVAIIGAIPHPEDWGCDDNYFGEFWRAYAINSDEELGEVEEMFGFNSNEEFAESIGFFPDDMPYYFSKCNQCGKIGFHFGGRSRQCDCVGKYNDIDDTVDWEALERAYTKARQARFEHGAVI